MSYLGLGFIEDFVFFYRFILLWGVLDLWVYEICRVFRKLRYCEKFIWLGNFYLENLFFILNIVVLNNRKVNVLFMFLIKDDKGNNDRGRELYFIF